MCNKANVLHLLQKHNDKAFDWNQLRNSEFLPKFIVSIKALRFDIVNCNGTKKHERIIHHWEYFYILFKEKKSSLNK